jgi:formamidopyrimidine-DNA glycosylase
MLHDGSRQADLLPVRIISREMLQHLWVMGDGNLRRREILHRYKLVPLQITPKVLLRGPTRRAENLRIVLLFLL